VDSKPQSVKSSPQDGLAAEAPSAEAAWTSLKLAVNPELFSSLKLLYDLDSLFFLSTLAAKAASEDWGKGHSIRIPF